VAETLDLNQGQRRWSGTH